MNCSIDSNRDFDRVRGSGLARVQHALAHLFKWATPGNETPAPSRRPAQDERPTRAELFRQVQHEKWLGGGSRRRFAQEPAQPPKDLYKRVLLDPNTLTEHGPGARTSR